MKQLILSIGILFSLAVSAQNVQLKSQVSQQFKGEKAFSRTTQTYEKQGKLIKNTTIFEEHLGSIKQKQILLYDGKQVVSSESYFWDFDKNEWQPSAKTQITEQNGKKRTEEWEFVGGKWQGISASESYQKGQKSYYETFIFDGKWQPHHLSVNEKNHQGENTLSVSKNFNPKSKQWENSNKYETYVDKKTGHKIHIHQIYKDNQWQNELKTIDKSTDNQDIKEDYKWQGHWQIFTKSIMTTDKKNNTKTHILMEYDNHKKTLVERSKAVHFFDKKDRVQKIETHLFDPNDNTLKTKDLTTFYYDEKGNLIKKENCSDTKFENKVCFKTLMTYNANNDVERHQFFVKENDGEYKEIDRTIYHFHPTLKGDKIDFMGNSELHEYKNAVIKIETYNYENPEEVIYSVTEVKYE